MESRGECRVRELRIAPKKKTVHKGSSKADGYTECLSKLVSHPRVSRAFSRAESAIRPAHFPRRPLLAFGRAITGDQGEDVQVGGSVATSITVDIWSGKCIKDSFIAAMIHYVGDGQGGSKVQENTASG
ncbi:hypothetical protein Tcan_14455 [Toxocara canis]|uniref:Uncharacterized protein n=1 Tax=Toxocara canis TaxID=6265 RepID=A0A0B2VM97_TOXCA|nr:hypothetical protein Tcan_14455 [Toxocara canis]